MLQGLNPGAAVATGKAAHNGGSARVGNKGDLVCTDAAVASGLVEGADAHRSAWGALGRCLRRRGAAV